MKKKAKTKSILISNEFRDRINMVGVGLGKIQDLINEMNTESFMLNLTYNGFIQYIESNAIETIEIEGEHPGITRVKVKKPVRGNMKKG